MRPQVAEAIAEAWNLNWPTGTPVILIDDSGGRGTQTSTRSKAWSTGSDVLVLVDGKSGGYDLGRIIVRAVAQ